MVRISTLVIGINHSFHIILQFCILVSNYLQVKELQHTYSDGLDYDIKERYAVQSGTTSHTLSLLLEGRTLNETKRQSGKIFKTKHRTTF